jgi:hypothetical protein
VKQQVGDEKIRRLELELVVSRQRIETQALEAAAVATQLESAKQQVAQSSVLRKDKLDEAVVGGSISGPIQGTPSQNQGGRQFHENAF